MAARSALYLNLMSAQVLSVRLWVCYVHTARKLELQLFRLVYCLLTLNSIVLLLSYRLRGQKWYPLHLEL
jgi:hypothetical protein